MSFCLFPLAFTDPASLAIQSPTKEHIVHGVQILRDDLTLLGQVGACNILPVEPSATKYQSLIPPLLLFIFTLYFPSHFTHEKRI